MMRHEHDYVNEGCDPDDFDMPDYCLMCDARAEQCLCENPVLQSEAVTELARVTAERDALRKAVDHYADKDNWCESQHEDNVELDITWYIGADNEGRKYGWTVAAEALMEKVHADFAALIDRKKWARSLWRRRKMLTNEEQEAVRDAVDVLTVTIERKKLA